MTFFRKILSVFQRKGDLKLDPSNPAGWYRNNGFYRLMDGYGGRNYTGQTVTIETAMTSPAVKACVRNIGEDVGSCPLFLFERTATGREKAPRHPLYRVLHDLPNPETSAISFRESMTAKAVLNGNAYARIIRNSDGKILGLWQIRENVRPVSDGGRLTYMVTQPTGHEVPVSREEIFDLCGFSLDGIKGLSVIDQHKNTIGWALALESYAGRFFSQDATPPIVVEFPQPLSPTAIKNFKEGWENFHRGEERWHGIGVVGDNGKISKIGINPHDAQLQEAREFAVLEMCRIFKVPPHKVADLKRATFSNIEEQNIQYYTETIRPWLIRWEQAIYRCLLSPAEQGRFYAEHSIEGFLRGNFLAQAQALTLLAEKGLINVNEGREVLNRNKAPGGEKFFVQLNRTPLDGGQPQGGTTNGTSKN